MIVLGFLIDYLLWSTVFAPFATPTEFTEPPEDFPVLSVTVHMNEPVLAKGWCPTTPFLRGCAVLFFDSMTCRIYIVDDDESKLLEELRHRHCEGSDHKGETTISDAWTKWKEQRK